MPSDPITRRDLIASTAKAAAVAAVAGSAAAQTTKPTGGLVRPVAISSMNGVAAVKVAVERMAAGAPPVDAAVAGVALPEADPDDITVGYAGLPNEDGVVQLDAAVMDGVTMRAGAVAALERIKHPAQVALAVMRQTTRVLIVGEGALRFARAHGFPEENLLTERSRKIWLYWKENASQKDDWIPDPKEVEDPDIQWYIKKYGDAAFRPTGTCHLSACGPDGQLGCCTTTSGLAFKIPGRVGDSPLVGCGLYCDGEVGSAGGTGHGESNIVSVGAHTVVELMRQGKTPEAACLATLERVARNTKLDYLRDEKGRPRNNLLLYAVNRAGEVGGAAIWTGERTKYAVCRAGSEPQLVECAYLYKH
ncbi:MAG TPA: N(4)-(beta-N-acetylglucosaminyl)-L-asparaginase [Thermoanaerobaculaceae bacterium]|nr:N(4)-(beta-N-acetylglucosaminyl)-L-asparaginase [Thermoanaerobaculaceae bacterium]